MASRLAVEAFPPNVAVRHHTRILIINIEDLNAEELSSRWGHMTPQGRAHP